MCTDATTHVMYRNKTNVNGIQWAYRQSKPSSDKADSKKPVVVLVHGLGSSSWSWRCVGVTSCKITSIASRAMPQCYTQLPQLVMD